MEEPGDEEAQGQTLGGRVGVYLPASVFAHGQLYVALSRATSLETLRVQGFDARRVRVHPKVVAFHSGGGKKGKGEAAPCAQ